MVKLFVSFILVALVLQLQLFVINLHWHIGMYQWSVSEHPNQLPSHLLKFLQRH